MTKAGLSTPGSSSAEPKESSSPAPSSSLSSGYLKGPNKIWVDEKIGWLYVCGRDVFEDSIQRSEGVFEEGAYFLLMLGDNCLGYGRVETIEGRRMLRNIFDLGDFLRRERGGSEQDPK